MRLAYSIAIQVPFDILLLDEVLAVGDRLSAQVLRHLRALPREEKTIVFVSHDLAAVARFCGRALWLHQGRVAAIGDAASVIDGYAPGVGERLGV